ncbi:MAG: leucine-rich repeat protein [Paludibacteraceae bacterium]|nr:leucine-rich repeat protein [Paludibacteraceae bacterium]
MNTGAFANGYSLRSVTIPRSVEIVGDSVFGGCRSLKTVYNYAVTPQRINGSVFAEVDQSRCTLYVPKGSVPAYRAADVWKDFVIEEMPAQEGVETPSGSPLKGREGAPQRHAPHRVQRQDLQCPRRRAPLTSES